MLDTESSSLAAGLVISLACLVSLTMFLVCCICMKRRKYNIGGTSAATTPVKSLTHHEYECHTSPPKIEHSIIIPDSDDRLHGDEGLNSTEVRRKNLDGYINQIFQIDGDKPTPHRTEVTPDIVSNLPSFSRGDTNHRPTHRYSVATERPIEMFTTTDRPIESFSQQQSPAASTPAGIKRHRQSVPSLTSSGKRKRPAPPPPPPPVKLDIEQEVESNPERPSPPPPPEEYRSKADASCEIQIVNETQMQVAEASELTNIEAHEGSYLHSDNMQQNHVVTVDLTRDAPQTNGVTVDLASDAPQTHGVMVDLTQDKQEPIKRDLEVKHDEEILMDQRAKEVSQKMAANELANESATLTDDSRYESITMKQSFGPDESREMVVESPRNAAHSGKILDVVASGAWKENKQPGDMAELEAEMQVPYMVTCAYMAQHPQQLSARTGEIICSNGTARNGWLWGTLRTTGQSGWFPCSYMQQGSQLRVDDSELSTEYSDTEFLDNTGDLVAGAVYQAVCDYPGLHDGDLPLQRGDQVVVIETISNGWWRGSSQGRDGWFPGSYVEAVPQTPDDEVNKSHFEFKKEDSPRKLSTEHITKEFVIPKKVSVSRPQLQMEIPSRPAPKEPAPNVPPRTNSGRARKGSKRKIKKQAPLPPTSPGQDGWQNSQTSRQYSEESEQASQNDSFIDERNSANVQIFSASPEADFSPNIITMSPGLELSLVQNSSIDVDSVKDDLAQVHGSVAHSTPMKTNVKATEVSVPPVASTNVKVTDMHLPLGSNANVKDNEVHSPTTEIHVTEIPIYSTPIKRDVKNIELRATEVESKVKDTDENISSTVQGHVDDITPVYSTPIKQNVKVTDVASRSSEIKDTEANLSQTVDAHIEVHVYSTVTKGNVKDGKAQMLLSEKTNAKDTEAQLSPIKNNVEETAVKLSPTLSSDIKDARVHLPIVESNVKDNKVELSKVTKSNVKDTEVVHTIEAEKIKVVDETKPKSRKRSVERKEVRFDDAPPVTIESRIVPLDIEPLEVKGVSMEISRVERSAAVEPEDDFAPPVANGDFSLVDEIFGSIPDYSPSTKEPPPSNEPPKKPRRKSKEKLLSLQSSTDSQESTGDAPQENVTSQENTVLESTQISHSDLQESTGDASLETVTSQGKAVPESTEISQEMTLSLMAGRSAPQPLEISQEMARLVMAEPSALQPTKTSQETMLSMMAGESAVHSSKISQEMSHPVMAGQSVLPPGEFKQEITRPSSAESSHIQPEYKEISTKVTTEDKAHEHESGHGDAKDMQQHEKHLSSGRAAPHHVYKPGKFVMSAAGNKPQLDKLMEEIKQEATRQELGEDKSHGKAEFSRNSTALEEAKFDKEIQNIIQRNPASTSYVTNEFASHQFENFGQYVPEYPDRSGTSPNPTIEHAHLSMPALSRPDHGTKFTVPSPVMRDSPPPLPRLPPPADIDINFSSSSEAEFSDSGDSLKRRKKVAVATITQPANGSLPNHVNGPQQSNHVELAKVHSQQMTSTNERDARDFLSQHLTEKMHVVPPSTNKQDSSSVNTFSEDISNSILSGISLEQQAQIPQYEDLSDNMSASIMSGVVTNYSSIHSSKTATLPVNFKSQTLDRSRYSHDEHAIYDEHFHNGTTRSSTLPRQSTLGSRLGPQPYQRINFDAQVVRPVKFTVSKNDDPSSKADGFGDSSEA